MVETHLRVLVVDDDTNARAAAAAHLRQEGHTVIEAATTTDALAALNSNPAPDLVLAGLMPHAAPDGLSLPPAAANRLAASPDVAATPGAIPVIMMVDDDDDATLDRIFGAGAVDYIVKPVRERVLRQRVTGPLRFRQQATATEAALAHSRETLDLALNATEMGIWDWDLSTDCTYYSAGWMQALGYESDEIEQTSQQWRSMIHPEDYERVQTALQAHFSGDTPYMVEHRLRTKTSGYQWVLANGRVIERDDNGRPLRMVGVQLNIQDEKRLEQAIQQSEERHRIISETISDYAYSYIVQPDGTLRKDWSTAAFHEITGYTFEEMDANGWQRLIHPADSGIAKARFMRLLQGEVDISEFRIITKSGEVRWLRDHGHPVVDEQQGRVVHIYGAAQDITERKHFEAQLQQQAEELRTRNEELDTFAYTVAHDLKNPISSMMGFASLVRNYSSRMSEESIKEYLSLILESGYQLKEIINALLLLAGVTKDENAEIIELDMQMIVDDAKRRLAALIEEKQARILMPEEWPSAAGYGPWVAEVWTNYLSNALKYGGEPPAIELGAERESDEMVRFWVRDNGRGLTDEEQQRVFTPFTRLNQVKIEGHGLGLSIVQRIVQKLGGEVSVYSEVGQGSTFSFTLPVRAARSAAN
ncbi:MAG: PAS domain-containing protein [Chloroflexota bacterium]